MVGSFSGPGEGAGSPEPGCSRCLTGVSLESHWRGAQSTPTGGREHPGQACLRGQGRARAALSVISCVTRVTRRLGRA